MTIKTVTKEQLIDAAGTVLEPSPWYALTQERINHFADCTEDQQFIHIDEALAKQTPLGGTIAHGFLTLSMLVKMAESCMLLPENLLMGMNYGFDRVRFLSPVHAGKRVRMLSEVISVEQKSENRFLVKLAVKVEIEDEETPALIAEWLNLFVTA